MSQIGDAARVSVLLADYALTDAINKVNVLGAGWAVTGLEPQTGMTAPQCLVVLIDVPPAHYGESFTVGIQLRDSSGGLVEMPGPAGQLQPLRIAQISRVEEPTVPGVPRGILWAHSNFVFSLVNGLPLRPDEMYTWHVEIDGEERSHWAASFFVAAPVPPPVVG
jgi:hypothetical protein